MANGDKMQYSVVCQTHIGTFCNAKCKPNENFTKFFVGFLFLLCSQLDSYSCFTCMNSNDNRIVSFWLLSFGTCGVLFILNVELCFLNENIFDEFMAQRCSKLEELYDFSLFAE